MKNAFIIISLLVFISCQDDCTKFKDEHYNNDSIIDSNVIEKIHEVCDLLNEPNFNNIEYESYRLIYGNVLYKKNYLIRIDKENQNTLLTYKVFTGQQDSLKLNVTLKSEKVINLSKKDWTEFIKMIYETNFWLMEPVSQEYGLDGTTYYLEGRRPQALYCNKRTNHFVRRWSPKSGGYKQICDRLIFLADKK